MWNGLVHGSNFALLACFDKNEFQYLKLPMANFEALLPVGSLGNGSHNLKCMCIKTGNSEDMDISLLFCKYNQGPSLKIEYLKSGLEYLCTSFIGLKFGISRITRLWFQVFKWLHLWMAWIWKSGFECKFPVPEGIMKNTKKHPTLPDHCDPTTCSKLDYKVPIERGYPYLSYGTFESKLGSLLWPHWALIQPEANNKMKNHGVMSPYPLRTGSLIAPQAKINLH